MLWPVAFLPLTLLPPYFLRCCLDLFNHSAPGGISMVPALNGLAVPRQGLELAERCIRPVHIPNDHRDDSRLTYLMPLESAGHLDFVAVIRSEEVGANQEHD